MTSAVAALWLHHVLMYEYIDWLLSAINILTYSHTVVTRTDPLGIQHLWSQRDPRTNPKRASHPCVFASLHSFPLPRALSTASHLVHSSSKLFTSAIAISRSHRRRTAQSRRTLAAGVSLSLSRAGGGGLAMPSSPPLADTRGSNPACSRR